jgi:protein gp37
MGENSKIEWTHHTFNPWIGCEKCDPLCDNCYAESETFVRVQRAHGVELWGPGAHRHVTSADNWKKPLRWNRDAIAAGERHRVFCASLGDVCEDRRDLDATRARLWDLVRATSQLDFLFLTKRPQNIERLIPLDVIQRSWLGVSAGTVAGLKRVEFLMRHPAKRRFVSMEPLLEDVDFDPMDIAHRDGDGRPVDLVIVGGESGFRARPTREEWVRSIRDNCTVAGVSFFYKQTDETKGRKVSLPMLDGRRWAEMPEVRS